MVDNQHRLIKGYRELSQEEIDLVNAIKQKAEEVGALVAKLSEPSQLAEFPDDVNPDMRWVSIAKTHLQQGFMALVRAVTKPDFF